MSLDSTTFKRSTKTLRELREDLGQSIFDQKAYITAFENQLIQKNLIMKEVYAYLLDAAMTEVDDLVLNPDYDFTPILVKLVDRMDYARIPVNDVALSIAGSLLDEESDDHPHPVLLRRFANGETNLDIITILNDLSYPALALINQDIDHLTVCLPFTLTNGSQTLNAYQSYQLTKSDLDLFQECHLVVSDISKHLEIDVLTTLDELVKSYESNDVITTLLNTLNDAKSTVIDLSAAFVSKWKLFKGKDYDPSMIHEDTHQLVESMIVRPQNDSSLCAMQIINYITNSVTNVNDDESWCYDDLVNDNLSYVKSDYVSSSAIDVWNAYDSSSKLKSICSTVASVGKVAFNVVKGVVSGVFKIVKNAWNKHVKPIYNDPLVTVNDSDSNTLNVPWVIVGPYSSNDKPLDLSNIINASGQVDDVMHFNLDDFNPSFVYTSSTGALSCKVTPIPGMVSNVAYVNFVDHYEDGEIYTGSSLRYCSSLGSYTKVNYDATKHFINRDAAGVVVMAKGGSRLGYCAATSNGFKSSSYHYVYHDPLIKFATEYGVGASQNHPNSIISLSKYTNLSSEDIALLNAPLSKSRDGYTVFSFDNPPSYYGVSHSVSIKLWVSRPSQGESLTKDFYLLPDIASTGYFDPEKSHVYAYRFNGDTTWRTGSITNNYPSLNLWGNWTCDILYHVEKPSYLDDDEDQSQIWQVIHYSASVYGNKMTTEAWVDSGEAFVYTPVDDAHYVEHYTTSKVDDLSFVHPTLKLHRITGSAFNTFQYKLYVKSDIVPVYRIDIPYDIDECSWSCAGDYSYRHAIITGPNDYELIINIDGNNNGGYVQIIENDITLYDDAIINFMDMFVITQHHYKRVYDVRIKSELTNHPSAYVIRDFIVSFSTKTNIASITSISNSFSVKSYYDDECRYPETEWISFDGHNADLSVYAAPTSLLSAETQEQLEILLGNPMKANEVKYLDYSSFCVTSARSADGEYFHVLKLKAINYSAVEDILNNSDYNEAIRKLSNDLSSEFTPFGDPQSEEYYYGISKAIQASMLISDMILRSYSEPNMTINTYFNGGHFINPVPNSLIPTSSREELMNGLLHRISEGDDLRAFSSTLLSMIASSDYVYTRIHYLISGEYPQVLPCVNGIYPLPDRYVMPTDDELSDYVANIIAAAIIATAIAAVAVTGFVVVKKVRKMLNNKVTNAQARQDNAYNDLRNDIHDYDELHKEIINNANNDNYDIADAKKRLKELKSKIVADDNNVRRQDKVKRRWATLLSVLGGTATYPVSQTFKSDTSEKPNINPISDLEYDDSKLVKSMNDSRDSIDRIDGSMDVMLQEIKSDAQSDNSAIENLIQSVEEHQNSVDEQSTLVDAKLTEQSALLDDTITKNATDTGILISSVIDSIGTIKDMVGKPLDPIIVDWD